MIVVESVKLREVSGELLSLAQISKEEYEKFPHESEPMEYEEFKREVVEGKRFYRTTNGETQTWIIGYSKQVQEALAVPMQSIDNLYRLVAKCQEGEKVAVEKVKKYEEEREIFNRKWGNLTSLNLAHRLIFLFIPKKVLEWL